MKSKLEIRTTRLYVICPTYELRELCIKQGWFTQGSVEQYEKLFELNIKLYDGEPAEDVVGTKDIAMAIWLCSDACYTDIVKICAAKRDEYIQRLYEAEGCEGSEF